MYVKEYSEEVEAMLEELEYTSGRICEDVSKSPLDLETLIRDTRRRIEALDGILDALDGICETA